MNLAPYIVAGVVFAGFGAGWLTATVSDGGAASSPASAVDLAQITPAGAAASAAATAFLALDYGVPAPIEDAAAQAPPPPDIAVLFRRDLTAIEATPRGRVVWVVDANAPNGRRALSRGQTYRDGWVVSAITDQAIDLRKQGESRHVAAFEPPELDQP